MNNIINDNKATNNHYRPSTKLGEGNVFTSVCLFTGGYPWFQVLSRVGMPGPTSLPGVGGYVQGMGMCRRRVLAPRHGRRERVSRG